MAKDFVNMSSIISLKKQKLPVRITELRVFAGNIKIIKKGI